MTWYSADQAAKKLGIAPRTLRWRFETKPTLRRSKPGYGRHHEYWIEDETDVAVETGERVEEVPEARWDLDGVLASPAPSAAPVSVEPLAFADVGLGPDAFADIEHDTGADSQYQYVPPGVPSGDRYIFSLRSKPGRPFVLAGDVVRALVQAYSNDGGKATLNQIARVFGLHRASVRELLKALGKTHDSAPFTDEEIAARSESDLGEDMIRLKEEKIVRDAERKIWDETKRLADRARHFEKFVAERIEQVIRTEGVPAFAPVLAARPGYVPRSSFSVFATPSDLHYGKAGWRDEVGSEEYDRNECHRRLMATTDEMIERVLRLGRPDRWIIGAGSDWFHIDSEQHGGATTRGTPQDTDGTLSRIFLEGGELHCAYVDRLRQVAPVAVRCMAGNHDRFLSLAVTQWIAERFRASGDVDVVVSPAPRQYVASGRNLIGITHGEETKDKDLPGLMAAEARELWGQCPHTIWFTGHMHTQISNEYRGTRVIHVPSLAGSDNWHARHGYVGNRKALTAYALDDGEGLIAEMAVSAR